MRDLKSRERNNDDDDEEEALYTHAMKLFWCFLYHV